MALGCTEAEAERARALVLLLATLETVAGRLDVDRVEDIGLIARIDELQQFVREDLERLRTERDEVA